MTQSLAGLASADLRPLRPGANVELGPFKVEAVRVTHSTPDSVALADAVIAWSAVNGAAALGGTLGTGRDGTEPEA